MKCQQCGRNAERRKRCKKCGLLVCLACMVNPEVPCRHCPFAPKRIRLNERRHDAITWAFGGVLICGRKFPLNRDTYSYGHRRLENPEQADLRYHGGNYEP